MLRGVGLALNDTDGAHEESRGPDNSDVAAELTAPLLHSPALASGAVL